MSVRPDTRRDSWLDRGGRGTGLEVAVGSIVVALADVEDGSDEGGELAWVDVGGWRLVTGQLPEQRWIEEKVAERTPRVSLPPLSVSLLRRLARKCQ